MRRRPDVRLQAAAGILAILAAGGAAGCRKSAPANVAATVNSRPITNSDLDKQLQLQFAGTSEKPQGDQLAIQRLEVLRGMIDAEIMLQQAEKQSLGATDSEIEAKLNEIKAPYTQEEFQKQLNARNMSLDDLKAQLRRDLSVNKLINKEITSRITITDKDVADFYNGNRGSFNLAEPQVHLAQIVVTPERDSNIRNLRNDNASDPEQAKNKILMIDARLRQGEDFATLAQSFSEDPATSANGGDLGFVPESALEKANPELRKMVMSMQPGQVSRPINTGEGYRILRVISREPAGQRELNDPRVQQSIRETLMNRKDQLLRAAFYEKARNEAEVRNYLANSVIQQKK